MGKLRVFQLSFTNSQTGVFQAGQSITGQLFMDLEAPMKMRSITLQFLGHANVHWTERHSTGSGKNRRTTTRHYNNDETYFNQTVVLWGQTGGSGEEHPPGQYNFPFQFQLPQNLPSSFEGSYGRVRYSVKANIDKPWKFDHNTKLPFTILSVFDLNQNQFARSPCDGQQLKHLCCLCCKSGPISCRIHLDRKGYVPGEFIQVVGEVDNKSNRTLISTKVKVRMVTIFHARSKSRSSYSDVTSLQKGEVKPGFTEIWNGERMHLPPVPPSELIHCNIIDIKYYVVMIADPSGPAFDLEAPVEIVIGTIPLQNVYGMYANSAFQPPPQLAIAGQQPAPYPTAPQLPASEPVPTAPPPSYAESVFGKVNVREENESEYTMGQLDYAPQYTYYTFDKPAA